MMICSSQQVFMVFYAVFWAFLANVQPRWKAFHWTLASEKIGGRKRPGKRLILSFVCLNILPIVYFGLVFRILRDTSNVSLLVMGGVLPALGVFGFYRIWLGCVEFCPDTFYLKVEDRATQMPLPWLFSEPTYADPSVALTLAHDRTSVLTVGPPHNTTTIDDKDMPIVYVGDPDSGKKNLFWGFAYVVFFGAFAILSRWLVFAQAT